MLFDSYSKTVLFKKKKTKKRDRKRKKITLVDVYQVYYYVAPSNH